MHIHFSAVIFLFAFMLAIGSASAEADWTVMVFLNGDNNVDAAAQGNLEEMIQTGSSDRVNIVVLQDKEGNDNTFRHVIGENSVKTVKLPEKDMGDWNEAFDFFQWSVDNLPAKKYLYIIWNHGEGWIREGQGKSISFDYTSGTEITTPELGKLTEKMHQTLGRKLDILGYDACLMAMVEVAYETAQHTDFVMGSQYLEPLTACPYMDLLSDMKKDPSISPRDLACLHVCRFIESYSNGSQGSETVTQSAVDCKRLLEFMPHLDNLAQWMIDNSFRNETFKEISAQSQNLLVYEYKDLYDFTERLMHRIDDKELADRGEKVLKGLTGPDPVIIAAGNTGGCVKDTHGLSIYIPEKNHYDNYKEAYSQLKFAKQAKWDDFLAELFYPKNPSLTFDFVYLNDSSGDDEINPGDTVCLNVTLCNEGQATTDQLDLSVKCNDRFVTLGSDSHATDPGIVPGACEKITLSADISPECPRNHYIEFVINVCSGQSCIEREIHAAIRKPFEKKNTILFVVNDVSDSYSIFYTEAIEACGFGFDVWDCWYDGRIDASIMGNYRNGIVIFAQPDITFGNYMNAPRLSEFETYLESGGSLFITGQDLASEKGNEKLFSKYLCTQFIKQTTPDHAVLGKELFQGLELDITGGDENQSKPDIVSPFKEAKPVFCYDTTGENCAGTSINKDLYKAVFLSFGFEGIRCNDNRKALMEKVLLFLKRDVKNLINSLDNMITKAQSMNHQERGRAQARIFRLMQRIAEHESWLLMNMEQINSYLNIEGTCKRILKDMILQRKRAGKEL